MPIIEARWSGTYPCLCHGEWTLFIDGVDMSSKIPDDRRHEPMNTAGTYQTWYFDENWCEQVEDYEAGLDVEDWIAENREWLNTISMDRNVQEGIFDAFQCQDWQYGSCGGCI